MKCGWSRSRRVHWHSHADTDELFLILDGELDMEFRDRTVTLQPGELIVVPKGTEHRPCARKGEVKTFCSIDPKDMPNTGDPETATMRSRSDHGNLSESEVARRAAAGRQARVDATSTDMTFSIFLPPQAEHGEKLPVVWYLSGLTCTHANVTEKGEYRAACAELGLIFVAPDTSPRGDDVPDAEGI